MLQLSKDILQLLAFCHIMLQESEVQLIPTVKKINLPA